MFYLDRKKNRKGQLKRWMFTTDPGPKAIGLDVDYTTALEQQAQLNAALPPAERGRKRTDPIIPEGYGHPVTVNIPTELLDQIPAGLNRSAVLRNGLRLRLGLEPSEPE